MRKKIKQKEFEKHIIEYKEKYYRVAFSYVKNKEDALDIVQESIYKALTKYDRIENVDALNTWMYRIVINTSIDFLRKIRKIEFQEIESLERNLPDVMDKYSDIDLEDAIEKLPLEQRKIVILRFFEDLKIKEIACILGENENTIKTKLYKILKNLKTSLDKEDYNV